MEPSSRRPGRLLPALALIALLAPTVRAASANVAAENFRFAPAERAIAQGDTVVWSFSGEPHTVTSGAPGSPDGRFDSGIVQAGGTYARRFDAPGTFPYFCAIHPEDMVATVVVTAAATSPPTAAPTPRSTPPPTPRSTPRPTSTPTATARPTATAAPTATPRPTVTPTVVPAATAEATPAPTVAPDPSASAVPATPSLTPAPSAGRSPNVVAQPTAVASPQPAADETVPAPVAVGVLLVAVLLAGAVAAARFRSRGG